METLKSINSYLLIIFIVFLIFSCGGGIKPLNEPFKPLFNVSANEIMGEYILDSVSLKEIDRYGFYPDSTLKIVIKPKEIFYSYNIPDVVLSDFGRTFDSTMFSGMGKWKLTTDIQTQGNILEFSFQKMDRKYQGEFKKNGFTGYLHDFNGKIGFLIWIGDPDSGRTLKFVKL